MLVSFFPWMGKQTRRDYHLESINVHDEDKERISAIRECWSVSLVDFFHFKEFFCWHFFNQIQLSRWWGAWGAHTKQTKLNCIDSMLRSQLITAIPKSFWLVAAIIPIRSFTYSMQTNSHTCTYVEKCMKCTKISRNLLVIAPVCSFSQPLTILWLTGWLTDDHIVVGMNHLLTIIIIK